MSIGFEFQSTRPVWGATGRIIVLKVRMGISIHAPRVGRDRKDVADDAGARHFNPRAPCGARPIVIARLSFAAEISIHAPRVGRDPPLYPVSCLQAYFNPRAPCGARPVPAANIFDKIKFQSTRPVWGATANLTILPRQICTKGTKEFLLGRKTHGKKGKIK